MKMLSVSFSLLSIALCAGCSTNQPSTTSMGASPSTTASNDRVLYCKDGAYMPKSVGCPAGVERDLTPPSTTPQQ